MKQMKTTTQNDHRLRSLSIAILGGAVLLSSLAFKGTGNRTLDTIDVQRINIIEPDGKIKMIITNVDQFPTGKNTLINGNQVNPDRKKRSGMIFFNEDGLECGGFIYDGAKNENGHSSGLSLTYDQYDGDQVMQLIATDVQRGDKRRKMGALIFNDRPVNETTEKAIEAWEVLNKIDDREEWKKQYNLFKEQGIVGGAPRILLGKTGSEKNGLFLHDDDGKPRAMFYIDVDNQVKLEVLDEEGEVVSTWPNPQ